MQSTQIDVKEYGYFAGNQWRNAVDNQVFEVHEPYSGKLFARVAAGSRADGRTAVDAAAKAFAGWAETTPAEKARLFLKASEIVKRRRTEIAEVLARKRVHLQVLDQSIDTSDATGRLLFNMLGAIAQFETELRAERQREGIQKAHERGVHFGRQKKLTLAQMRELQRRRAQGTLIKTLMYDYGLSKVSVYRYLGTTDGTLGAPHG